MCYFKQLWSSFWRKNQGLGMIEAAITLPLLLLITFGVMEFGNMFLNRYQVHDVAKAVADYLQAKPKATSDDLEAFLVNLGLGLKNIQGEEAITKKIKIKSEKTMMTVAEFDALCDTNSKTWTNPWLGDNDDDNDKNPYYIHVCYPYSYQTITPLPKLMAGGMEETKILKGKAMAYIDGNITCPTDQVLQSVTGGVANCVPRDKNYQCPTGQILEKIVDGQAYCVVKDNNYTCASGQVLKEVKDGASVCVDRDASYNCGDGEVLQKAQNGTATCVKAVCSGDQVLQKTQAGSAVCIDRDTGSSSCPSGQVVTGVVNGVPTCSVAPTGSLQGSTSSCQWTPYSGVDGYGNNVYLICPAGLYVAGMGTGGMQLFGGDDNGAPNFTIPFRVFCCPLSSLVSPFTRGAHY